MGLNHQERVSINAKQSPQIKGTATILVVDDNEAVLRTTLRSLDAFGFTTVPAPSGQEALRLIASGRQIDLVLADFAMPEMNGLELAKTIQARHPALPVIPVTGYGNREGFNDPGEVRILQKPYTDDELLEEMTRSLHAPVF
jgi:CheY-like chemotaxis protein